MRNESNIILSWGKINIHPWVAEKGIPVSGASKSNLALSLKVNSGLGPAMSWSWSEWLITVKPRAVPQRVTDSQSLS